MQALPLVVPVLIGMFWGAPLAARELESGTFRLAWTQGRTRWQWLVGKLVVVGLSSVVTVGLLSVMTTWWWSPINKANPNRFSPGLFGIFGVTPVGYVAFAVAIGLLAGLVLRRTLPAMVTTLVAFIAARVVVSFWVRPHFASPVSEAVALNTANGVGINKDPMSGISVMANPPVLPNAWVSSAQLINHTGQQPSGRVLERICPKLVAAGQLQPTSRLREVRTPVQRRTPSRARSATAWPRSERRSTRSWCINPPVATGPSKWPRPDSSSWLPWRLSLSRTGGFVTG